MKGRGTAKWVPAEEEQQVQLQHSDYEHQDGGSAAVSSTRRAVSMPTSLSSSTLASDDEAVPGEPQGSSPLKDSHHGRASAGPRRAPWAWLG